MGRDFVDDAVVEIELLVSLGKVAGHDAVAKFDPAVQCGQFFQQGAQKSGFAAAVGANQRGTIQPFQPDFVGGEQALCLDSQCLIRRCAERYGRFFPLPRTEYSIEAAGWMAAEDRGCAAPLRWR